MTGENPYVAMDETVLGQHLKQLSEVVASKKIDVKQFFSIPTVSAEDQKKLENYASLEQKVKDLAAAATSKNLSENEVRLSQVAIDNTIKELQTVDPKVPIAPLLDSKFNNIEKLDILKIVQPVVQHFGEAISTLRKEIGNKGDGTTTQTFAEPDLSHGQDAEKIITEMLAKNLK